MLFDLISSPLLYILVQCLACCAHFMLEKECVKPVPGPVCSLSNYQLDFISPGNNNSPPLCAVKYPDPAAVCV